MNKERVLLFIIAAVVAAYANALTASFQFDDWDVIVDQSKVHSIVAWAKSMPGIRPLLKLSYALNWTASPSAFAFHGVNVAIHAANACLIFTLLARRAARPVALTAALIFALHPVQTESVTYVTGRSVSLSALFVLLSLALAGWLSSAAFAASILVKETAVMAAVPLILGKRAIGPLIVLAGALVIALVIALVSPWYRHLFRVCLDTRSIGTNLMTQAHGVTYLLGQLVRLDRLNADPKLPEIDTWSPSLAAEAALILGLIALGLFLWRRRPEVAFGILWFFLWLLPTNSILPRLDVANDRQVYLALAGPAWLAALGCGWIAKKRGSFPVLLVAVLALGLAAGTHLRNRAYADELTFWNDVVAKAPHNARGFNNLGYALSLADRDEEADAAFVRALELDPTYVKAAVNLKLLRAGQLAGRRRGHPS